MRSTGGQDVKSRSNLSQAVTFPIEGLSCGACVARVERALLTLEGVVEAHVNLAAERADVRLLAGVEQSSLVTAIEGLGYKVPLNVAQLAIGGMSCAGCVGRVERALLSVPGVVRARVNLTTERAQVDGNVDPRDLIAAVQSAGKTARDISAAAVSEVPGHKHAAEADELKRSLLIAAVLALPVFALEMGSHVIPGLHHLIMKTIGLQLTWLLQFGLTTLVLMGPGRVMLTKGVKALVAAAPDMNSLVAVGASSAYLFSVVATFAPGLLPPGTVHVYFEAAAVIVTLIIMGRWLEARAKGRTSEAIARLVGLQVKRARVQRGSKIEDVDIADVVVGDLLEVRPGERLPVDGEVLEGSSYVDESMISGESIPLAKDVGSKVVGGTINQTGTLVLRATAVGRHTVLAQIIGMVEAAQGAKLPIQAMVDQVTLYFVPAVMALALVTFAIWSLFGPEPALTFGFVNAVAVLIIACPCAMGLAAPTSIMVGTGRGAELGILFRKGEALQLLKDAKVVAVDKTGTLTEGAPHLTDFEVAEGFNRDEVLARIAAAEAKSEHPIARAIVQAAEDRGLSLPEVTSFRSVTGMGVTAVADGVRLDVGADRFMTSLGYDAGQFEGPAQQMAVDGKTPLYAAINGELAALLAVSDPIKATTPAALQALHRLGLQVVMMTGDHHRTAQAIADPLAVDDVISEVLPHGKVAAVKELKSKYGRVVFVGDGINDGPALAEADVGFAIGSGTDVAIEAADVVLMSGSLEGVASAIALSKATLRNIKQNLFWAFAYNIVLLPVAAGLLYPLFGLLLSPVFAAGAMAMSSVFVLTNALRLRRWRAPHIAGNI